MILIFRWLLRAATALIVAIVAGLALVWYFAARSLPDYDATETVAGITAPVEIVRNNDDVPHVFGSDDRDVFFGLGWAHAQDRLWQMILLRRTAQGRLSELFGERTLASDMLLRRLDLYGLATSSVAAQDEDARAALEAYAAGVNAWLAEVNAGARGRGAPEMWLFNHAVAPWQPADSLAILKLLALRSTTQVQAEVLRARTSLLVPPERLADILPDDPLAPVITLPSYAELMPGVPRFLADSTPAPDPLSPVPAGVDFAAASNAWAAGVARSASGATLLASDPHVDLTAPSLWYLARLELSSGGVIGATVPGVPLVMQGRSADLGWGVTAAWADDQDVFVEEVNPANAGEYRGPDGWTAFEHRESIIEVKDRAPVTITLQWTANGPVIPPEQYNLGTIRPPGHVTAIAWTGLDPADTSLSAGLRIMRARTLPEALAAGAAHVAPAQMLTLADRNRVAIRLIGRLPRRAADSLTQGRMPSFGYLPQNRWQGFLPYADNPGASDPPGGIVGHTNNRVTDAPFPRHVSFVWGDSTRIARWSFLMQQRAVHTRESFIEAQLDTVSQAARTILPLVGADLWYTGEAAPQGTPERRRQEALALLADWNGEMNEHMPEPLIYAAWMRALQERLIRDDLGPLADAYTHVDPVFLERVFRNTGGAGRWCDVLQSARVETCTDLARSALDDALVWIADTYGTTLESLRWGDAHVATHDHAVLGETPILSWFVNIRQPTSGGDDTLNRGLTAGTGARPFANVHAAGYRGVYDFADPDSSVFVIATGQSGHPLSRFYDDLGALWRRGEYVPMSLDPALARAGAVGVTHLLPLAPPDG
ncbi:MAG: penicillin acylase family protein [Rubellimicrobium sp.]|nr:penicillin acylase family protein [Rubellimicrobium sp.]